MQRNWSSHDLLVGIQNITATLENRLAVSYRVKHILWLSNLTSRYLTERSENSYSHKNLYIHTYSSSIHNHPKLEITPKPFNGWMDKQTVVHSYDGMVLSHKKDNNEEVWIHTQLGWISRALCWVKEASFRRLYPVWFHLHDILKRQNYSDREKVSDCQRLGTWGKRTYNGVA